MYNDKIEIRDVNINGETNWYWIKEDTGSFDGPKDDWEKSHHIKFFEHVKNFDTIVTGGTSCGMYVRFYAKMFKHVYAFEPDPMIFHCMVNNCPYDNVYKLNAAMGHGNGLVGLERAPAGDHVMNIGMNRVSNPNTFKIPMLSIDSLNLDSCDVIQLDVEGFESYVIAGAQKTIEKHKPVIIAERFDVQQGQDFMKQINYKLVGKSALDAIYIYEEPAKEFLYRV